MNIGIDAVGNLSEDTGGKNYLTHLIKNLQNIDKDNSYFIFINKPDSDLFKIHNDNFNLILLSNKKLNFFKKILIKQFMIPKLIIKFKLDKMYFPDSSGCIFCKIDYLLLIQNLIIFYKTREVRGLKKFYRTFLMKLSVKKAKNIIVPSFTAKELLVQKFKIIPEKISVIYHGVDEEFFSNNFDKDYEKKIIDKFNLNKKYILYVSALWEYKNHTNLIKAFGKLIKEDGLDLNLVLAGKGLITDDDYIKYLYELPKKLNIANNIIFTGDVSKECLKYIYKNALVFIMPSMCESFGFPVIEAMASGIPVISSNAFALKEIVGDAGILMDASDCENIYKSLKEVIFDSNLRNNLVSKAKDKIKIFSWENCIKETLSVLLK
ncbi:MAG: glycosyltransferase family 1 protein [Actinomycetota bacterium]|nr:glycosyltransferase family 1 protein [Actinomycetota bacterium]